jgi:HEAT repeat protein
VTTFYCPGCWAEVEPDAAACPRCGADIEVLDEADYAEKLCRALRHPEGFTARRAAWLLGQRGDTGAVEALADRARDECGVYLAIEIADALASIDTSDARSVLRSMERVEGRPLVRRHVETLLARLDPP